MRVIGFVMFFLAVLSFFLTIGTSSYAGSGEACYSAVEAEAEQGIRIHSELMVIGLNCAHMADANGNNLYMEHKKFSSKHKDLYARYEEIMMDYLARSGDKDPEKSMHSMRTNFANKISNQVASMRPDIFCRTYAERIEKASKMDRKMLRKWSATPFPGHPVSRPLCK
ncbi:MAG: hypothetical protein ACLFP8_09160 [Alphaproteobacteria bacterium]